ncbi:biotin-dependent carboxyltransferase family protein [Jatrophihabitans telluris]|uniref:Biotin-dependent carboxyltransferase family protein n=1 Tax=Jatrophihabitans telluris TaxID=2038343 RepID=A0ABY4R3A5_9ACTN|nr:biotin-dependent carboxyltransferase family protein [Jatrophihabitans telluris]UQX89610.1 biotin-dependent carboxyltransferase family protein [Jatrophihabitans telluris]
MIEVLSSGPLLTVQDLGRRGYRNVGVATSGAFDQRAHRFANAVVGNSAEAATLEITLGGLSVRTDRAVTIALAGARTPVRTSAGAAAVDFGRPVTLPAGCVLMLGTPPSGVRTYLAVRGGFDVPSVLGSRSIDTLSALGGRALGPGDRLPVGDLLAGDPLDVPLPPLSEAGPVRVHPGPQRDWFTEPAWPTLLGTSWLVRAASNRVGLRLDGPRLERRRPDELPSAATLPGTIQVPPDGRPIVLGPDGPVTGGYPVIAVVHSTELSRLAQLRPGDAFALAAVC